MSRVWKNIFQGCGIKAHPGDPIVNLKSLTSQHYEMYLFSPIILLSYSSFRVPSLLGALLGKNAREQSYILQRTARN